MCLAKAVHSLLESQGLHVGRVQRSSPSPTGRPVLPSLVAPRGARPWGVAHFLHVSLGRKWHQEGTCSPGWVPCRLAGTLQVFS